MTHETLIRAKAALKRVRRAGLPAGARAPLADLAGRIGARPPVPARPRLASLHHMACTGGTLISRAIAASPGVRMLSELDPFSEMTLTLDTYTPTDLIRFARLNPRGVEPESVAGMFRAALAVLARDLDARGGSLVLRDHTHSHFGYDAERPLMRDLLEDAFANTRIVTIRHPLDSWLALRANGWVRFSPDTLGEYARRYGAFLDAYAGDPVFTYEAFVTDPDTVLAGMCAALDLPFTPDWRDHMQLHRLSGDSGRRSAEIGLRPRRAVPAEIAAEARENRVYQGLCARLGYDPDPAGRQAPA